LIHALAFKQNKTKGFVDTLHANEVGGKLTRQSGFGVGGPTQDGKYSHDQAARLFRENPIIRRAILFGSNQIKVLNWDIFAEDSKNRTTKVRKGYPYKILEFCNPQQSFRDLVAQHYADAELYGNAFIVIEKTAPEYANISPLSLYPLNPKYVQIVPDEETKVRWYVYKNGTDEFAYPENMVIHTYEYASSNYYLGDKAVDAADFDIQIEKLTKRASRNIQQQAAVISGVLTCKNTIGADELARLKKEFNEQYAGSKNSYRVLVLEKDMEYKSLNQSSAHEGVMELITQAQKNQAIAFGVPFALLDAESKDIDKLESFFWRTKLVPWALTFQETVTKKLCAPVVSGLSANTRIGKLYFAFRFKEVQALRREMLDDMRVITAALNTGKMTPNEAREFTGDDPYDGEAEEFGNLPRPVYDNKMGTKAQEAADAASPSLTLPGSMGGRDQSDGGEAQLVDETGTRSVPLTENEKLLAMWNKLDSKGKQ
jgi:HK97 family phage portal protein